MQYYQQPVAEVFRTLNSSENGLDEATASAALDQWGPNQIQAAKGKTVWSILLNQFKDFMILVLLVAAIISGFMGELVDTLAIIVIVLVNAVLGFVQEFRAEKAMQALKQMAVSNARVLREGGVGLKPAVGLVPGDVVLLEAGDIVPADLRLFEANALKAEEASLTGESAPVNKSIESLPEENLPLGDRANMAYKSTLVTFGKGRGVVVATGMNTELGRIATMLDEDEVATPLQRRLTQLGKRLALLVLIICAVVFAFGLMRGERPVLMLLTAISLAVAAIPEALPSLVSITLALGARRMAGQKALVRNLPAVETLGSVTYICSDKTGTLTENKMTVEKVFAGGKVLDREAWPEAFNQPEQQRLLQAMALNNNVEQNKEGTLTGDPTEIALHDLAGQLGIARRQALEQFPLCAEIPFDSDRKCMTTIHQVEEGYWVVTKGAVDVLLERAGELTEEEQGQYKSINEQMSADGLRVLGFAEKFLTELPAQLDPDGVEKDLKIMGLAGIIDPPREEAKAAIAECRRAGIRPMMITGDHPLTARNIAERLGMVEPGGKALSGSELSRMSAEEFAATVPNVFVYARVSPEQKLNIVKALQANGQFVAMTGDGVNDAPSLKRSDIGVAMGITGTDVSKEAADLILLDDNFATIVKAVRSGRRIYDNIRKFIKYAMTGNTGEIWLIFLAPFFGLPIPLLPVHILWVNLVTDGLPGLALAMEPAEKDIMSRPPRHPKESVFAGGLGIHIIWVGLLLGFVSIFTQYLYIDSSKWQTMVFTVLCFSQMAHVFAIRSERQSLFSQGIFSNKALLGAVLVTLVLQLAVIYVPWLQPVFRTEALTASELGIAIALSTIVFMAVEIEKIFKRKKQPQPKVV
jgi:Ca2+-transporting ATPase